MRTPWIGGIAAMGLLAGALGAPAAGAEEPIKIGVVQGITGAFEVYAKQVVEGFKLGLEYGTQGKMELLGRKIQLLVEDDQLKPDVAKRLVTKLYADDKVDLVVGTTSSAAALAVLPVAAEFKKLLIVEPAVADSITGEQWNRYVFVGITSVVGKAGGGWLSDTIGREVTYTLGTTLLTASVGMLGVVAVAPGALPAYAYGALVGLGYSVTAPLLPALVHDVFHGRHFGVIFGLLHVANAVGGGLGPWVAGRVFDVTGGYRPALIAGLVSAALSTAAVWLAGRGRRRPDPVRA